MNVAGCLDQFRMILKLQSILQRFYFLGIQISVDIAAASIIENHLQFSVRPPGCYKLWTMSCISGITISDGTTRKKIYKVLRARSITIIKYYDFFENNAKNNIMSWAAIDNIINFATDTVNIVESAIRYDNLGQYSRYRSIMPISIISTGSV